MSRLILLYSVHNILPNVLTIQCCRNHNSNLVFVQVYCKRIKFLQPILDLSPSCGREYQCVFWRLLGIAGVFREGESGSGDIHNEQPTEHDGLPHLPLLWSDVALPLGIHLKSAGWLAGIGQFSIYKGGLQNEGLKKFLGWVGVGVGAKLLLLLLISIYKQRKPDWAGNWRKRSQILQYIFSSYIHVGVWNVRSIQAFPILKKLITYSLTRNIFRENVFTVCCKKRKRN